MKKFLWALLIGLSMIEAVGCGGGSSSGGSPSPTPTPLPSPSPSASPTPVPTPAPASGEFLFQGSSLTSLNLTTIDSTTGALGSPTLAGSNANDSAVYPGVALTPSKGFLYAMWSSFTVMQGFAISGPGVTLNPLKNTPYFLGSNGPLNSMVLHPNGHFLYLVHSPSTVEEENANPDTGDLSFGSAVTEPVGDFRVAVIDPAGKFLYVTDLTGSRIFGYQINQTDGSLTTVPGSPFSLAASSFPNIDVMDSTGKFLYVTQFAGGVAGFAINATTGALTEIPGSPFLTNNVPVFMAADPVANFVYVNNSDGSINGYSVDPVTGALTQVPGSPFGTTAPTGDIAIDPLGKFVYVANPFTSQIFGFTLDATTGSLSAMTGSPFAGIPQVNNLYIVRFP